MRVGISSRNEFRTDPFPSIVSGPGRVIGQVDVPLGVPYKSKRKQREATRASVAKWYQAHKAKRAAYMRRYRRKLKERAHKARRAAYMRKYRRRLKKA